MWHENCRHAVHVVLCVRANIYMHNFCLWYTQGREGCKLDSEEELQAVGALLGVSAEALGASITHKITVRAFSLFS